MNSVSLISLSLLGASLALIGFMVFSMILTYIYFSLTLMLTAKKLSIKNTWLAWIPVANLYLMSKMAQKHWWPILLVPISWIMIFFSTITANLISIIPIIFILIWTWKILEFRGRPKWWALLLIIPFLNFIWAFIMWGILAWGKTQNPQIQNNPNFINS